MKFGVGDTVEVIVDCAYTGEVGTVKTSYGAGLYVVQFFTGERIRFSWYELRLSQQRLDLPRGG